MIARRFRKGFAFFERPMTRSGQTALLLLLGSAGLVVGGGVVLVLTVPSVKHDVKERWHRWSCPDVPKARSERSASGDGIITYSDPFPFCALYLIGQPTLFYDFECPQSTFFTRTDSAFSGEGVLSGSRLSTAIVRRAGDVAEQLTSISAGFMLRCASPAPDVRIVIRIDHPDGTLLEWNEKRLLAGEHRPAEWERFNFEWILRDLPIGADDLISVFLVCDEKELIVDDLSIVFRSSYPLRPSMPHA